VKHKCICQTIREERDQLIVVRAGRQVANGAAHILCVTRDRAAAIAANRCSDHRLSQRPRNFATTADRPEACVASCSDGLAIHVYVDCDADVMNRRLGGQAPLFEIDPAVVYITRDSDAHRCGTTPGALLLLSVFEILLLGPSAPLYTPRSQKTSETRP
jgi:hypothetical protein